MCCTYVLFRNFLPGNMNSNAISCMAITCHKWKSYYKFNKPVKESLLRELAFCIWEKHVCMHVGESRIHAVKSCNIKWLP